MVDKAKELIKNEEYSCIVLKNNELLHCVKGRGIMPLLNLYINNKNDLKESFLLDKVIGKAAAKIAIDAKIKYVYGYVMSKNAVKVLEKANIQFEHEILIDNILNKDGTDLCPIEKISLKHNDIENIINDIAKFLNKTL